MEKDGEPASPVVEEPDVTMDRWVSYFLDNAGNRYHLVDTGVHKTYTANNFNQYTQTEGASVGNGLDHEVRDYQAVHYEYINDERLKQVNNNYYLYYDALGRCVKRRLNNVTTYYIYDGEKPIIEYNSAGTLVGRNLYGKGIDEILMRTYGAQTYYFQQDRNGNVTHLTNAAGAIAEKYKYDAFGAVTIYNGSGVRIPSTAYNNRFLFTGREYAATYAGTYTPAFTFYEYRARAYNPVLGRFMSEDPKGFDAGDYNLFRYCHNDPLDRVDPMGLGDEQVNAQMVKVGYVQPAMHVGSHIPTRTFVQTGWVRIDAALVEGKAQGGLIMGRTSKFTPIRNPNAKAYAEVRWGGETAIDYQSLKDIRSKYGTDAYTTPNLNEPTGRIDSATGKIEINQTITATRHLPHGAGPGTHLYNIEARRVEHFRGATGDASAAAQALAFRSFSSIAAGVQAVRQSTYDVFNRANLEYQTKVDVFGDFHP
jgi:RHS repeat-associated protein